MSEFPSEQSPTYSPGGRAVMNYFLSRGESQTERAQYEARGLVFTNNLGLYIAAYDSGPEGRLSFFYNLLTPRTRELFENVRAAEPELWQQTLEAYEARSTPDNWHFEEPQAAATLEDAFAAIEAARWHYPTLATRIFNAMEPLTEEEALDLCR